jgi:hypothetical protein
VLEVGVDEVLITAQSFVRSVPHAAELRRHLLDVEAAAGALDSRDLRSAFPSVDSSPAEVSLRSRFGLRWEEVTFPGPVALPAPLADTWAAAHRATTSPARLRVLRHDEPRPWVIVVHGAQQGIDFDLRAFRVRHLHHELGLNVALPVLPLHGPRRPAGVAFVPGFDVLLNVGTALLSVSEIAAARAWMAEQADTPVGLYGVSLGGYIAGLAAGVIPGIDLVIAAMPVVSVHRLVARHLSRAGGGDALELAALMRSEPVMALERFVDPLAYEPTVPIPQRHVIGGLLDRVTTPHQAVQLAQHWRVPAVRWYPGGHIGHAWSSAMHAHVDLALGHLHDVPPPL